MYRLSKVLFSRTIFNEDWYDYIVVEESNYIDYTNKIIRENCTEPSFFRDLEEFGHTDTKFYTDKNTGLDYYYILEKVI